MQSPAKLIGPILGFFLSVLIVPNGASAKEWTFYTQDLAPFHYPAGDEVKGIVVDITNTVCAELKFQCKYEVYTWPRAQKRVMEGDAEGVFMIVWTEERAQHYHFSPGLFYNQYGFFVPESNPLVYKELADVQGYRVASYGPSFVSTTLLKIGEDVVAANLKPMTLEVVNDDPLAFRMLSKGKLDAVFNNLYTGWETINQLKLDKIRYAGTYTRFKLHIALSKKRVTEAEAETFNNAVRKLQKDGTINAILDKAKLEPVEE